MSKRYSYDESAISRVKIIGAQLANVAFNWGQTHDKGTRPIEIDTRNLKMLYDLSKAWDEAVRAMCADEKPVTMRRKKKVKDV